MSTFYVNVVVAGAETSHDDSAMVAELHRSICKLQSIKTFMVGLSCFLFHYTF